MRDTFAQQRSSTAALQLRRRPLLGITLVFIAGTAIGWRWTPPVAPTLAAAALALIPDLIIKRRPGRATWLFPWLAVALTAVSAAAIRTAPSLCRNRVPLAVLADADEVHLTIRVDGDPFRYTTVSGRPAWSVPAKLLTWQDPVSGNWSDGRAGLTVHWRASEFSPAPRYGDHWRIRGRFYASEFQSRAPARRRVWAHGAHRLAVDTGWRWVAHCYAWRHTAAERLTLGIEGYPERIAIIQALLLGLRQGLTPSIRAAFSATGTLHIVAISGLHVGVMTALFIFVLQSVGISRNRWFYFLAPCLIGYTLATGARPSAVRACIMALAYWSALPLRRRPDAPSALALAALIVLAADPDQLAMPGFIFSFTVVAGLMVFFKPLNDLLTARLPARGVYQLPVSPGMVRREFEVLLRGATGLVVVSMVAWVVTMPLSARFFSQVSLVALPANLLVVPLAFLIVVTGCLAMVCGAIVPVLGVVFNHANLVWVGGLLRVLRWFSGWPGAAVTLSPPVWVVPLWYAALVMLGWRLQRSLPLR